jgi:hypothetical protein
MPESLSKKMQTTAASDSSAPERDEAWAGSDFASD